MVASFIAITLTAERFVPLWIGVREYLAKGPRKALTRHDACASAATQNELGISLYASCVASDDKSAIYHMFRRHAIFGDFACFLHSQTDAVTGEQGQGVASAELTALYYGEAGAAGKLMLWFQRRELSFMHQRWLLGLPRPLQAGC